MLNVKSKIEIKYIGKKITYGCLRNAILDLKLTENDTILLNPKNFDDVILEYLEEYKVSMSKTPHLLLGVLIREDFFNEVPHNRIGVFRNDNISKRKITSNEKYEYYDTEVVYRCGWCGNIVDNNGNELFGFDRERVINYIQNYNNSIVYPVNGKCCPKGYDS